MNSNIPTEETIRQYLLGRLDSQSDLEKRLSERLFLDAELSEQVDVIEDEMIEEYLDGRFSAADEKAIEDYFLGPPERREKLQLARLLRNRFEIKAGEFAKEKGSVEDDSATPLLTVPAASPGVFSSRPLPSQTHHWQSHWRTYCELAACFLLVAVSAVYVSRTKRGWQSQLEATRKTQVQLEGQLVQERERSATLAKRLEELRPSVVALTFFGPTFRDQSGAHEIEIKPWTRRVKVEIGLPTAASGDYSVLLETKPRNVIWSGGSVVASAGALRFDIPAEEISTTGSYCLVVSSRPEPYCFQARVSKN